MTYFIGVKQFLRDQKTTMLDYREAHLYRRGYHGKYEDGGQQIVLDLLDGYQPLAAAR